MKAAKRLNSTSSSSSSSSSNSSSSSPTRSCSSALTMRFTSPREGSLHLGDSQDLEEDRRQQPPEAPASDVDNTGKFPEEAGKEFLLGKPRPAPGLGKSPKMGPSNSIPEGLPVQVGSPNHPLGPFQDGVQRMTPVASRKVPFKRQTKISQMRSGRGYHPNMNLLSRRSKSSMRGVPPPFMLNVPTENYLKVKSNSFSSFRQILSPTDSSPSGYSSPGTGGQTAYDSRALEGLCSPLRGVAMNYDHDSIVQYLSQLSVRSELNDCLLPFDREFPAALSAVTADSLGGSLGDILSKIKSPASPDNRSPVSYSESNSSASSFIHFQLSKKYINNVSKDKNISPYGLGWKKWRKKQAQVSSGFASSRMAFSQTNLSSFSSNSHLSKSFKSQGDLCSITKSPVERVKKSSRWHTFRGISAIGKAFSTSSLNLKVKKSRPPITSLTLDLGGLVKEEPDESGGREKKLNFRDTKFGQIYATLKRKNVKGDSKGSLSEGVFDAKDLKEAKHLWCKLQSGSAFLPSRPLFPSSWVLGREPSSALTKSIGCSGFAALGSSWEMRVMAGARLVGRSARPFRVRSLA